ncbi:MAG: galactose mutarotase [Tannerella sp.]|jgi:aldose 1-epimerase|nr:galactose mutarotase [Tannerella sp.]
MNNELTLSCLRVENFRRTVNGKETALYILRNKTGFELTVTNYGAKTVSLTLPDRNGNRTDVVTGHDSIDDYLTSEEPYFGAVCGRYANRIANARFTLDGREYRLAANNGPNCLHGGIKGFHAVVWEVKRVDDRSIELMYVSADGEEGFPGTLTTTVTYTLTDNGEMVIGYHATTDRPTVLNLTNHSYFNLSGAGDPYIGDHRLIINADYYLPTDETSIPLGAPEKVEGTPMDFRTAHEVGERIRADFKPLIIGRGYDHTFLLNGKAAGEPAFAARCSSPKTGIVMDLFTTEPGMQLYTGNWMTGNLRGKNGRRYPRQSALCFETQHYPDSPNRPDYPGVVLRPGEVFESQTICKFSTESI